MKTYLTYDDVNIIPKYSELKLIDEKTGELLLECNVSDKTHQSLLEVGLNTILEKFLNEKNKT